MPARKFEEGVPNDMLSNKNALGIDRGRFYLKPV